MKKWHFSFLYEEIIYWLCKDGCWSIWHWFSGHFLETLKPALTLTSSVSCSGFLLVLPDHPVSPQNVFTLKKYHLFVTLNKVYDIEERDCRQTLYGLSSLMNKDSFCFKQALCTDGSLFSYLETTWKFAPGHKDLPDSCKVDFYVSM